jgi:hypothetical protein
MPDKVPECLPEHMPVDLPDRMSEDMPENMPDRLPEDMPEHIAEDMPGRMPEDLPVTKRIDVMVGITRSKVILRPVRTVSPCSRPLCAASAPNVSVKCPWASWHIMNIRIPSQWI